MNGPLLVEAIGVVWLLGACFAAWLMGRARSLQAAASVWVALALALCVALLALGQKELAYALPPLGFISLFVLLSAANDAPRPAGDAGRFLRIAAVLLACALPLALLLGAGPMASDPPGALLARRVLAELPGAAGVQAALLSYRLGWLLPALAAALVAAGAVTALLRHDPRQEGAPLDR